LLIFRSDAFDWGAGYYRGFGFPAGVETREGLKAPLKIIGGLDTWIEGQKPLSFPSPLSSSSSKIF